MSWIYPAALVLLAVANVVAIGRRRISAWWQRRRTITDWCEVCGKGLTRSSVRELRSDADDDAELEIYYGGTAMIATYCRRHFPR